MSAERVRTQLDRLAAAGLDTTTFAGAAIETLHRGLPFAAACLATADPATELVTGTVKWGGLTNNEDSIWAHHEYEVRDLYDFRDVVRRPGGVTTVRHETAGQPERSPRYRDFFRPHYGFGDELRAGFRVDGATWGFFALFRDGERAAFTPAEEEFVSSVASAFATGLRAGMLAAAVTADVPAVDGPAVLVVDPAGEVVQASMGAAARVADLGGGPIGDSPLPFALVALVTSARRFAAGGPAVVPRARLRTRSGQWVVAHASPLLSRDGASSDVVVTIEEARPPEIVPLVVAAFGLTARERDVVQLVLQGVDTAEVARTLHLSAYTVQDHLKSIFNKVGVRSRRELTARVFFDHYAPRIGGGLAPSGWFASA